MWNPTQCYWLISRGQPIEFSGSRTYTESETSSFLPLLWYLVSNDHYFVAMDSTSEVRERGDIESESKASAETTAVRSRQSQNTVPTEAVSAHLDSGKGSGSMNPEEDWVRAHHQPIEHDGRSPTRTYFDGDDVRERYPGGQKHRDPEDRRSWQTLSNWQDGVQSDISRGGQNWWADKQRWVDMFADRVGATRYHRERCKHIMKKMDVTPFRSSHTTMEVMIVAILSLLIDNDIADFENRAYARDGTEQLLDDLDSDLQEYEDVRGKLKKQEKELLFPE